MRRILIVEDECLIAQMLDDGARELGWDAGIAMSNKQALKLIAFAPPHAAIVDLQVIDGDTYPTARALQSLQIPFIFATGHASSTIDPAFAFAPIVAKPFDFTHLEAVLSKLVSATRNVGTPEEQQRIAAPPRL